MEIERKYLVVGDGWRRHVTTIETLRQGYVTTGTDVTVRVRVIDGARAFLTIKGGGAALARSEFEYEVPVADGPDLLDLCGGILIEKRRHHLSLPGGDWVVDVFEGTHLGLVLAEAEIASPSVVLQAPDWLGREVTGDASYYNSHLAQLPPHGEI